MSSKIAKFVTLFWSFFKIGLFTFGGGYAMIPLIEKEASKKHQWISEEEIFDIILIAESTPGPISINAATYIGYNVAGISGAIFACLGLILPGFTILFIISLFLTDFLNITIINNAFLGIKAAVALLVMNAGIKFFHQIRKEPISIAIASSIIILLIVSEIIGWSISSIFLIVCGLAFGLIFYALIPQLKKKEGEKK